MFPKLDNVSVTISIPIGSGSSADPNLSLLRPLRQIAQTGRPTGTINYVFLRHGDASYTLGALCYSPGLRLLFFPGLRDRVPAWRRAEGKTDQFARTQDEELDHLTVEPNLESWHPRFLQSDGARAEPSVGGRSRIGSLTKERSGLVFLFSLSVKDLVCLERLPETTVLECEVPSGDAARRVRDVMQARDGAIFHVAEFHPQASIAQPWYAFFAFVVDTRDEPGTSGLDWGLVSAPTSPPLTSFALEGELDIPIRSHPVCIPEFPHTVWICVGAIPTQLEQKAVFGSYG